ncbi:MAG: S53 family peptidase [Thermoprotei archaeon]
MQFKNFAAIVLGFLSLSLLLSPVYALSPSFTVNYYAKPLFSVGPSQGGVVWLGFPYPEGSPPYTPSQVANYYGFDQIWREGYSGQGETIVIVDAFGSPTIYLDTAVFDSVFDLPPISLNVIKMPGQSSSSALDREGWAMETSLDVEWAHAMAPKAKIVLIEASSDSLSALYQAVEFAVKQRVGQVISMSWGLPEPYELEATGPGSIQTFHQLFKQAALEGITLVASSGDDGANNSLGFPNVNYPASDPYVLAVGGTNLTLSTSQYGTQAYGGATISTTAEYLWNDSGGGQSEYFKEPSWQSNADLVLTTAQGAIKPVNRTVPDVSYVAASPYGPSGWGGLWIFDSTPLIEQIETAPGQITTYVIAGWYGVGGTSCGAPGWSALVADSASGALSSANSWASFAESSSSGFGATLQISTGGSPAQTGLGLIAPRIYAASASYTAYFNPVSYYNGYNNNGYYYYSSRWDAVTGWGSPKAEEITSLLLG